MDLYPCPIPKSKRSQTYRELIGVEVVIHYISNNVESVLELAGWPDVRIPVFLVINLSHYFSTSVLHGFKWV